MQIVFNNSLPRSGSTLLQNILAQNPRFYCSPTSSLLDLLYFSRKAFTEIREFNSQDGSLMRRGWAGFCRGGLLGWYHAITDKPVAVDKCRGWMAYWDWVKSFYPEAKLICCVRDLRGILSSMEKLHRKNMMLHDPQDDPARMKMVAVEARINTWLSTPPVGLALERLRDAVLKRHDRGFYFVVYERFTEDPKAVMAELYEYLGEAPFQHTFDKIAHLVTEKDSWHGIYGDHQIKTSWLPATADWDGVLGKEASAAIRRTCAWFYDRFYKA